MARKGEIFNHVATARPKRNTFNLSHDRKLSTKFGELTPCLVMDVVPGDNITLKGNAMIRLAPMLAPVMHRMNAYIHYFFVPNRILWPSWEKFITGGEDGNSNPVWANIDYNPDDFGRGELPDHMGLPIDDDTINGGTNVLVNGLPFAAYQMIYNEYYRDQNLQLRETDTLQSGTQPPAAASELLQKRTRNWQHDYFTSCLPWTQKGPEALLPLGTQAPIEVTDTLGERVQTYRMQDLTPAGSGVDVETIAGSILGTGGSTRFLDLEDSHFVDLSEATAASINDLRRALALQTWLERNARGGSRYTESIHMHFGVQSSDKRLQRPEFIGGLKTPIQISEVLQTSNNDTQTTPQGTMAGHGISLGGGQSYKYFAEEHGYIIGILSVMPESAYQQGVPKHFSRTDRYDYYWPEFAHIGEQAVLRKELALSDDPEDNEQVFGYIPRYSEYKFMSNTVHGDMKNLLDFWTMSRKFSNLPALNGGFLEMDYTEVNRIFAVQGAIDHLWCQVYNEIYASRLMPVFGTPKIQ